MKTHTSNILSVYSSKPSPANGESQEKPICPQLLAWEEDWWAPPWAKLSVASIRSDQSPSTKVTPWKLWEVNSRDVKARYSPSTAKSGASTSKKQHVKRSTVTPSQCMTRVGQQVQLPLHPSNCQITNLKIDKDRKALLERKKRVPKSKDKHKEGMGGLDWSKIISNLLYPYLIYLL